MRLTLLLILASACCWGQRVVFETSLGDIEIQLEPTKAPATVANFLRYVDDRRFDGGRFHRTVKPDNQPNNAVKIEVIQAGPRPGTPAFAPIPLERTNATGLKHLDGTVSMGRARTADSGQDEVFICIGDQPELDYGGKRHTDGQGFAAFGQVVRGMDVVRKIQQSPATAQRLTPVIEIRRVVRLN